ncbi:MAG: alkaline phosphatase family protein [Paramuribaculum sp.]|nr:alkaline phosphatase family protein [Barnesiella sp.]MDE5822119.1 alkaline phosphatase family protein [Paramuribaculum sp.]MDE5835758.1 alkaline phosphatase family protein [Paramuribaculum sp.]
MRKKKEKFISDKILGILLVSLIGFAAEAQNVPARPKLVVGIMVEGLNADYLSLLENRMSSGGFRRLMSEGANIADLDYGTHLDAAAATALIFTGTTPPVNKISAAKIYDPAAKRVNYTLLDTATIGNFTEQKFSPAAIAVSTLGDEVKIDAGGTGWVYSIASDPETAIIMAGHAGNSAFWIDNKNERWATSTYYKDVPATVTARNYQTPLSAKIDTMSWETHLAPQLYPDVPSYKVQYPYRHTFSRKDANRIEQFKASPKVNTEITRLACDYLTSMQFGQREAIDMLNLAYTLAPYPYTKDGDNKLETMDAYIRLDRDLASLFKTIDAKIGKENALIFLVGHPTVDTSRRDDDKWGIPTGVFSAKKAASLLNSYLMALHGNGEWVQGYYDRNFYLNRQTIKNHSLDPAYIRAEAAEFLERMSGVSTVFTIDDIIASRAGDNAAALKRNTSIKYSGDIIVNVTPGWEICDDFNLAGVSGSTTVSRDNFVSSPAFIMGPGVSAVKINTPVDARTIAPTVSRILRIRSPNAASLPAIKF